MEKDFNYAKRILAKKNHNPFISQTDLVYALLLDDIMLRYRKLGSKINQDELAYLLKVSRSPIRDAINRLIDDGFLVKQGKRGCYVYIPTMKDVTYVSEFRVAIEINAALLTTRRVTDSELAHLQQIIKEQSECDRRDMAKMISLDMKFHDYLVSCCKSEYIICAYMQYAMRFRQLHIRIASIKMHDIILSEHKQILSAIENKNNAQLETIMRIHLSIAEDFINAPDCIYD